MAGRGQKPAVSLGHGFILNSAEATGGVESAYLWISPERARGGRVFRNCTACGRRLFNAEEDCLEFHGTHPRAVLCMSCKALQDAKRFQWWPRPSPRGLVRRVRGTDSRRPTSVAVTTLSFVLLSAVLAGSVALRSSQTVPELDPFDQIGDLVLVFAPDNQGQVDSPYLAPYVSRLGEDGERKEWLFDTFLLLAMKAEDGSSFWGRTTSTQWQWWIDCLFRRGEQIDALEKEVDEAKEVLGRTSRRGVVISIPYPSTEVSDFRMRSQDGSMMNFDPRFDSNRSSAHRLEACQWFCEEVIRRWQLGYIANLELVGFYWFREELLDGDDELVSDLSHYLHGKGYGLYWIPYNSEGNLETLRAYRAGDLDLGFDQVWIQPNYAFRNRAGDRWREIRDLDMVVEVAEELNLSIEIEVEQGTFLSGDLEAINSFYHYLDGGLNHYYMGMPLAYYVFPAEMYRSPDPIVRQSYDALCDFVKDRHQPVSYLVTYDPADGDDPRIQPQGADFGPVQTTMGVTSRLATPGATLHVRGLDPGKDIFLAMEYLTYHSVEVTARYDREEEVLGRLVGDGSWRVATWFIPISEQSRRGFELEISNLTWLSRVWVYPDETVFHLGELPESDPGPGLYTELDRDGEGWRFDPGKGVLVSKMDPQLPWLLTLVYRCADGANLRLSAGRVFQEFKLEPSSEWRRTSFLVSPHEGNGDVVVDFDGRVDMEGMWLCPERIRTNVGTAWDTNPQRHNLGASLGSGWSASRLYNGEPDLTYRTGGKGATLVIHPPGSGSMLTTLEYRAEGPVQIRGDQGELVATLPPSPAWGTHKVVLAPGLAGFHVLSFSGAVDLSSVWIEIL
jgi:hypothetical protein